MRKKILSAILALAMVAGMAVPAFAANSDRAGDAKKVGKIVLRMNDVADDFKVEENTIVVKQNKTIDLSKYISVFENETKLVLDHNHIRYMLNGNTGSGYTGDFRIDGSVVTAIKPNAEATVTIFDNYNGSEKARVTVRIKSVAGSYSAPSTPAESFTFVDSSKDVPFDSAMGRAEDVTVVINAHPAGSYLPKSGAELTALDDKVKLAIANALGLTGGVTLDNGVITTPGAVTVAGEKDKQTITLTTVADTNVINVYVAGQVVTVTLDVTTGATATAAATALVTALKANAVVNTIYDVTNLAGVVTLEAKANGAQPAIAVTGDATTSVAVATPGVTDVTGAKQVVTFDFTDAIAKGADQPMTIGGVTVKTPVSPSYQTLEQQLDTWVANAVLTGYMGGATAVRSGRKIIITADDAAANVPAVVVTHNFDSSKTTINAADVSKITADFDWNWDYNGDESSRIYTISKDLLTVARKQNIIGNQYYAYRAVNVPTMNKFNNVPGTFTASTNLNIVDAIAATGFRFANTAEVVVGDWYKYVAEYFPANANVGKNAKFVAKSFMNDGKPYQYAINDGNGDKWFQGVNSNDTAKVMVEGIFTDQNNQTRTMGYSTLSVKSANLNEQVLTPTISAKSKEIKVGEEATLAINNVPNGVTVKWTANQEAGKEVVSFDAADKAVVKVTGKAVGTVVVTATLSSGEKYTCDIDVAAAPAVEEKPTDVPATGDSFFANLF